MDEQETSSRVGCKAYSRVGHTYPRWLQNVLAWWFWKRLCCRIGWHLWDEVRSPSSHYLSCDACDAELILATEWIDAKAQLPYQCESVIGWCSLDECDFEACEVFFADNGWNSVRNDCRVTEITHWKPFPVVPNPGREGEENRR